MSHCLCHFSSFICVRGKTELAGNNGPSADSDKYDKGGQQRKKLRPSTIPAATGPTRTMDHAFPIREDHIDGAISIDDEFKEVGEEYYFDDTNDQSWTCSFGTEEGVCAIVYCLLLLFVPRIGLCVT